MKAKRKLRIYNKWSGNPQGVLENTDCCITEVWSGMIGHQCSRKRGHGKDKLYCKQHDPEKIKKKEDAKDRKIELKIEKETQKDKRIQILLKMAKGLSIKELKYCHICFKKD